MAASLDDVYKQDSFQFLIGSLVTPSPAVEAFAEAVFQFLIGSLVTSYDEFLSKYQKYRFNSLQVVQLRDSLVATEGLIIQFQFLIGSLVTVQMLLCFFFRIGFNSLQVVQLHNLLLLHHSPSQVSIPYRQSSYPFALPPGQLLFHCFNSLQVVQLRIDVDISDDDVESFNSLQVVQLPICLAVDTPDVFPFQFLIGSLVTRKNSQAILIYIRFQFLIGSLVTRVVAASGKLNIEFQFLIGSLVTLALALANPCNIGFQFLIGSLVTLLENLGAPAWPSFNSLQVVQLPNLTACCFLVDGVSIPYRQSSYAFFCRCLHPTNTSFNSLQVVQLRLNRLVLKTLNIVSIPYRQSSYAQVFFAYHQAPRVSIPYRQSSYFTAQMVLVY